MPDLSPSAELDAKPWYAGITRYQWIVLAIAAAGWAFDQYESQIFVLTKDPILKYLNVSEGSELIRWTIAAAGWAFDQNASQVFVLTKDPILKYLNVLEASELN